jgi:hypothetical protein
MLLRCCCPGLETFRQLARLFDFSQYTTLGDIGGSAGALCCAVAAAHPHIQAATHDLPAVHAAAVAYVRQRQLLDRVKVGKRWHWERAAAALDPVQQAVVKLPRIQPAG